MRRLDDLKERQVRVLVDLVQIWHASGGLDKVLEEQVRTLVSMELLSLEGPQVAVRALGELDVAEADRLQGMLDLCSQTFYRTDATWNAFAIPVAVRWHMKRNRIFIANRAQPEYMKELAAGIRQCLGVQKVLLDSAIYSATALYGLSAHALHDHLQHLVSGGPRFAQAPKCMALRSASEPPWRMAYFLGVEITKPGAKRRLHDPGVQDALQIYLHLGEDALTQEVSNTAASSGSTKFELGAHGETICHTPRYLLDAIQFGERSLRGYRLRQLLEEMAKVDKLPTLFYAFNPLVFALDLLLKGKWLAFDMRWCLFIGETVEDAHLELHAMVDSVDKSLTCNTVALDLEEFQAKRLETALGKCKLR